MPHDYLQTSDELHTLFGDLLRTRHISQPLATCSVDEDENAVLATMNRQGFTVLGVRRDGQLIGSIQREQLSSGAWPSQLSPLVDEEDAIDADAPLLELLRRLEHRHWLFVRQGSNTVGFVSRSDLQRAPVRMLLFGLISIFELVMLDLVQGNYSEEEIAETLNASRLEQARRLHTQRQYRGEELSLADCLQIADKRDLLLAAKGCSERLGFPSNNAASHFFGLVEELRDRLVHANDLIGGSNWKEVLTTTRELSEFLSRVTQAD